MNTATSPASSGRADILQRILDRKHEEIADRAARVSLDELRGRAATAPPVRGFIAALQAKQAAGLPGINETSLSICWDMHWESSDIGLSGIRGASSITCNAKKHMQRQKGQNSVNAAGRQ